MPERLKEIIIAAGPNGAGKTSFANAYLPPDLERLAFVNADDIARDIASSNTPAGNVDLAAGRRMLERIRQLVSDGRELMFETTLASRAYARVIPDWQSRGYCVALIYLRLPNVEASVARVARRVAAGGHAIPENTIRRRYTRSLEYFETIYKPIVDEWYVWDSLEGDFNLVEAWDD